MKSVSDRKALWVSFVISNPPAPGELQIACLAASQCNIYKKKSRLFSSNDLGFLKPKQKLHFSTSLPARRASENRAWLPHFCAQEETPQ